MKIREFTRNIYKYIKTPGKYTLSVNGKDSIVVTIDVVSKKDVVTKSKASEKVEKLARKIFTETYGCGCKKSDNRLCSKHNRI